MNDAHMVLQVAPSSGAGLMGRVVGAQASQRDNGCSLAVVPPLFRKARLSVRRPTMAAAYCIDGQALHLVSYL